MTVGGQFQSDMRQWHGQRVNAKSEETKVDAKIRGANGEKFKIEGERENRDHYCHLAKVSIISGELWGSKQEAITNKRDL